VGVGGGLLIRKKLAYPYPMRNIRLFGWVIIAFNIWWFFNLIQSIGDSAEQGDSFGVGASVIVWFIFATFINIVLYILYRVTARNKRRCPACDKVVKTGLTQCAGCGYDFKSKL